MRRIIVMEEFHITMSVSRGLTKEEYRRIRRTLDRLHFRQALLRAVRQVFTSQPALANVRVAISR